MALKNPMDLLRDFDHALNEIRGNNPLSPSARQRIADDLADVYNYVSTTCRKPSLTNVLHATSAQNAKMENQLEQERKTLHEHQQFVQNNFDKAEQYLRAIQLGGYAAFFALWSFTGDWLNQVWASFAAILMIISATTFAIWEIYKATILALALRRHASIGGGNLEIFLTSRMAKLEKGKSAVISLAESRVTFWCVSVISAVAAIAILLFQLLGVISKGIFG